MVNSNGKLLSKQTASLSVQNRGFAYGDALFETVRASNGKLLFWEDHYFRLMASMRIMRMEIPMAFSMEYLQEEIHKTIEANQLLDKPAKVKVTVFRDEGGLYTPDTNTVSFIVQCAPLDTTFYTIADAPCEVALYKDHYVQSGLLSTIKSNNKLLHILGGIYARENGFSNCLVLNEKKQVVEALNGNLFLVSGHTIKTPPITDGCLRGVLRKQILDLQKQLPEYTISEESISPFELQKADELFITNVVQGIVPITKYRKKEYKMEVAKEVLTKLLVKVRLQS